MSDETMAEMTGAWSYADLPSTVVVGEGCYLERKASFERYRSDREPGLVLGRNVRVLTWTTFNIERSSVTGRSLILRPPLLICRRASLIEGTRPA